MKKALSIFMAGALMLSPFQVFAQGITVSTTEEEITLTVDMGSYYAGKNIGIELIRPKMSVDDIISIVREYQTIVPRFSNIKEIRD